MPRKKGGRGSTSGSRLANPDTPIYALAVAFQDYMHIPDPTPIYVTMGAMAGNMLTGTPPWLLLAGESSSGKTMLLKSLLKLARVRLVGSVKNEAALMSGTKKKEYAKDATGGLLNDLGDNGCLAFMDFTTFMSKPKEVVGELLGVLRELFDQTYQREIGGEGGRTMQHKGRVCLIAGVTHAIDRNADVNGEMGQRSIIFRMPDTDGYQETMKAVNATEPDPITEAMQDIVLAMFEGLGLSFETPTVRRKLMLYEQDLVTQRAQLGVKMRNIVPRHWRTRDIEDLATREMAARMGKQLAQLYLGMEAIGVDENERWGIVNRIVLDSMPRVRRAVLQVLVDARGSVSVNGGMKMNAASVARVVGIGETTARHLLEDLMVIGVVDKVVTGEDDKLCKWKLTEWGEQRVMPVLGEVASVK